MPAVISLNVQLDPVSILWDHIPSEIKVKEKKQRSSGASLSMHTDTHFLSSSKLQKSAELCLQKSPLPLGSTPRIERKVALCFSYFWMLNENCRGLCWSDDRQVERKCWGFVYLWWRAKPLSADKLPPHFLEKQNSCSEGSGCMQTHKRLNIAIKVHDFLHMISKPRTK